MLLFRCIINRTSCIIIKIERTTKTCRRYSSASCQCNQLWFTLRICINMQIIIWLFASEDHILIPTCYFGMYLQRSDVYICQTKCNNTGRSMGLIQRYLIRHGIFLFSVYISSLFGSIELYSPKMRRFIR